jgi:hypothetical protein
MKKLILIVAVILITGSAYSQNFQKGNFVGFHEMTIKLDPNVTMNQYLDFYKNKIIPAYESNFQAKAYLVKGRRGECFDCFGVMFIWKSEAERDKFFNNEGGLNEYGKSIADKLKPLTDEMAKLGTYSSKYTDWIVQ